MKLFSILLFAACSAMTTLAGAREVVCPCDSPVLRAATFNANGGYSAPFRAARVTALKTELPQLANDQDLDVLCVNELWDPDVRGEALHVFLNDLSWYVYQPDPVEQPGCQDACANFYIDGRLINDWVQTCSFSLLPGMNKSCSQYLSTVGYIDCLSSICPDLLPFVDISNPACDYCLEDADPTESVKNRVFRCARNYDEANAANCRFANGGQAGGTLISRYPFLENDYHAFTEPDPLQAGLSNRGITYGKIQTASGPVHLFCANMTTSLSGMDPAVAEPLNAAQSQEVLDYIAAKADGEMALFLSDTGSGPALASSPAGPVNAEWPQNFADLEAELADALHVNLDDSSQPASAETCTYGCADPATARYVDHILSAGQAITPQGNDTDLCHRRGGVFFTTAIVSTADGLKTLSDHAGVRTDVCLNESVDPVATRCAMVGATTLSIGAGATLSKGSAAPNLCSNGPLTFGKYAQLHDAGSAQAVSATVLGSNGVLTGDLTSNGNVTLAPNSAVDGNVTSGGDADVKAGAQIGGDLSTTGISLFGFRATVDGTITEGAASPSLVPFDLPTCTVSAPGGPDISTAKREEVGLLPPGDYGAVLFRIENRVELCGDYSFKSLRFSPRTQIEVSCPTTLQVAADLSFGAGVTQTLSGTATPETVLYLIDGGITVDDQVESSTGANARLYGTLCAPNGKLSLGANARLEGALYGWSVDVAKGVEFVAAPATDLVD